MQDELSDDDMPFMRKKPAKPKTLQSVQSIPTQPSIDKPPEEKKESAPADWLMDPVSLYMRGMAQRRE